MKKLFFALFVVAFLFSWESIAQLPGFDPNVDDEVAAPISGFVAVGLAIGAGYGANRIRKKKK